MFKIAIVGRPNVGKSTLFNKFVGKKIAITDNTPGITRDRKESFGNIGAIKFIAIDTAGLEKLGKDPLQNKMYEQSIMAIESCDLCLFVIDGREDLTNEDRIIADIVRKRNKKTILIANKLEGKSEYSVNKEYYKLGFGEPIGISAEHKEGFITLYEAISPYYDEYEKDFSHLEIDKDNEKSEIQVAIIGRPNAGKSTLINTILGEERLITGPLAGITRDSISVNYDFKGTKIKFIDTAGIRKKANIVNDIEKASSFDSFRAITFCHVAILLIDANHVLDHQDMSIAGQIIKEGRGIIFAVNKIDQIEGSKEAFLKKVREQINNILPGIEGVPIIGISAISGYNVEKMLDFVFKVYDQWQSHITTSKLNNWISYITDQTPPNLYKGKATKIKYISQIKKRPPTFAVFTNHIKAVEGSYQRFLAKALRKDFDLKYTLVRVLVRKSDNPYSKKK